MLTPAGSCCGPKVEVLFFFLFFLLGAASISSPRRLNVFRVLDAMSMSGQGYVLFARTRAKKARYICMLPC